jgi:hypothetical protein
MAWFIYVFVNILQVIVATAVALHQCFDSETHALGEIVEGKRFASRGKVQGTLG